MSAFLAVLVLIAAQSLSIQLGEIDGREFELTLSSAVALGECRLDSFQNGPFGGRGYELPARDLGNGRFALRTGVKGVPAVGLKVAVWCRGYAIALVDVPSLGAADWKGAATLTPLPEVTITGRVLPPDDGVSLAGARLLVLHEDAWLCGFFNLPDCMSAIRDIGSGAIASDGSFKISLPDIARDPVIAKWSRRHPLGLRVDRTEPPYHYTLERDEASGALFFSDLWTDVVLRARRR